MKTSEQTKFILNNGKTVTQIYYAYKKTKKNINVLTLLLLSVGRYGGRNPRCARTNRSNFQKV